MIQSRKKIVKNYNNICMNITLQFTGKYIHLYKFFNVKKSKK